MEDTEGKVSIKFWIAALAFATLLLATTFALMASYLAQIKANTAAAVARADLLMQRNTILEVEISELQHHLIAQKMMEPTVNGATPPLAAPAPAEVVAPAAAPAPQVAAPAAPAATAAPTDVTPNAMTAPAVPTIKPPALAPAQQ